MLKKIFRKAKMEKPEDNKVFTLKIDSYLNSSGEFDYDKYKKTQTDGNKAKINNVWVIEENIKFLSKYLESNLNKPDFGICHGTRRGLEQFWFSKYLGCKVIGTEISDTAIDFPNTIQWDFHEVKEEWIGKTDFIYSNSLDHSYDPKKCLNNWMKCLKPGGICIIEHSDYHGIKGVNDLDPFGAELLIMPYLILSWSNNEFSIREIIEAPKKADNLEGLKFLILKNNN